jgi:hypothetical protein
VRYLLALLLGLAAAVAGGAASGLVEAVTTSSAGHAPADRATTLSAAIATGANCTAFLALLFVPAVLVTACVKRRRD